MSEDLPTDDDPEPVNNFILRVLVGMILAVLLMVSAAVAIGELLFA